VATNLTPASWPPASLAVSGTVAVSNFPADQLVHFAQPITVDASGFTVPVSGPLTNAQLRAADVGVDGSAHTQPVSAASLPLPAGAATEATLGKVATEATLQRVRRSADDLAAQALDTEAA